MTNPSARKLGSCIGAALLALGMSGCPHRVVDTSWIKPGLPSCGIDVREEGSFSQTEPIIPQVHLTALTAGFPKDAQFTFAWSSGPWGKIIGSGRKVIFDITEIKHRSTDVVLHVKSGTGQEADCFTGVTTNGRG